MRGAAQELADPHFKPKPEQPFAHGHGAGRREVQLAGLLDETAKIGMRREVRFAGSLEKAGKAVLPDGLHRVAGGRLGVTVVHDERGERAQSAARAANSRSNQRCRGAFRRLRRLHNGGSPPSLLSFSPRGERDPRTAARHCSGFLLPRGEGQGEGALLLLAQFKAPSSERDHTLAPNLRGFIEHELPHGQAIDELVRNHDGGAGRHILDALMPANRTGRAGKRSFLCGSQRPRRFDEMNC